MKGVDDVKNGIHDKTKNLIDTSKDPPTRFLKQIHCVFVFEVKLFSTYVA